MVPRKGVKQTLYIEVKRKKMNGLMNGKIIAIIFHDKYLASMLMGIIACSIALVVLLVAAGIL